MESRQQTEAKKKEEDKKYDKKEAIQRGDPKDEKEAKATRKKAEAKKGPNHPPLYFTAILTVTAGALCGGAWFLVGKKHP